MTGDIYPYDKLHLAASGGDSQKAVARHLSCIEYTDGSLTCEETATPKAFGLPEKEAINNEQAAHWAALTFILLLVLTMLITSLPTRQRSCQVPACQDRRYLGTTYCRAHYPRHLIEATKPKKAG